MLLRRKNVTADLPQVFIHSNPNIISELLRGSGKLMLTWKNKDKVLGYRLDPTTKLPMPHWFSMDTLEWGAHGAEGKLNLIETVGDSSSQNMLIHGDNLFVLRALVPVLQAGGEDKKIKLVYLDPPYNTKNKFKTYVDAFEAAQWLSMMAERLRIIKTLMREDGVIAIQVDDTEHAHLDLLLGEIFGFANKIGTIIWRRRQSQANLSRNISTIHDYIILYAKNLEKSTLKQYHGLWIDPKKYGNNQTASNEVEDYFGDKTAFDTPKPELLLYNIIKLASNKGDWVFDGFLGCGTTAAVAHKMDRRWIGIEMGDQAETLCKTRLQHILKESPTKYPVGITSLVNWAGGGGFQLLRIQYASQLKTEKLPSKETSSIPLTDNAISPVFLSWDKRDQLVPAKLDPFSSEASLKLCKETGKFQTIFYSPPLDLQDPSLKGLEENTFLSLSQQCFKKIRNLLREEGFLIIQVAEPYYAKLKIIADEIYGQDNFIATLIWRKIYPQSRLIPAMFKIPHNQYYRYPFDYIMLFAKDAAKATFHKFPPSLDNFFNPDSDPRGPWESRPLIASEKSSNPQYTYTFKTGFQLTRKFRYAPTTIQKIEEENRIHYTSPKNGDGVPRVKIFYKDRVAQFEKTGEKGTTPNSLWCEQTDFGSIETAFYGVREKNQISQLLPYQSPQLYEKLIQITTLSDEWILDCFDQAGIIAREAGKLNRRWMSIQPDQ